MKTKTRRWGYSYLSNELTEWFGGVQSSYSPPSWQSTSWEDYVTTGDNIPDWKRRIAEGWDATTSLEGSRKSFSYTPGMSYIQGMYLPQNKSVEYLLTGPVVNSFLPFPSSPGSISSDEANRKALTKFNNRVDSVNQSFNGGVFLGELATTLRGIRNPAKALADGIGSYRREAKQLRTRIVRSRDHLDNLTSRRRRQAVSSANNAIAGLWLEKKFHWDPLLSDIDDGVKTLAEMDATRMKWQIISATSRERNSVVTASTQGPGGIHGASTETVISLEECSVKYKGAVGIEPQDSSIPSLDSLGLGLRNFVPTMWELVPYSFVADYFSNVGDVINGWSKGGQNVRWAFYTVRKSKSYKRLVALPKPEDSAFYKFTLRTYRAPTMVADWTLVSRNRYTGNFIPSITWEIPGMSTKWINLGALFGSRVIDRFT